MLTVTDVNEMMVVGNVLMNKNYDDPAVLFEIASQGKTYVEIGTRWGGSAVIAGLAGCEVHCIDDFVYPKPRDLTIGTVDDVVANWTALGLSLSKLHIHPQLHPPWPTAIKNKKFDIGLIDSAHTEEQCRLDWESMKKHVTKYVLFHDVGIPEIQKVFQEAAQDADWEIEKILYKTEFGLLSK